MKKVELTLQFEWNSFAKQLTADNLSLLILLKYADKFYNSYNSMYLDEHLDATDIFESI